MKFKKILHAAVLLLIGHTAFSKADEKPTNFFSYLKSLPGGNKGK